MAIDAGSRLVVLPMDFVIAAGGSLKLRDVPFQQANTFSVAAQEVFDLTTYLQSLLLHTMHQLAALGGDLISRRSPLHLSHLVAAITSVA